MTKILIILVLAAIIESVGVAVLSMGLKEIHGAQHFSVGEIIGVIRQGVTNGKVLLGVALEAVFFGALLYMLSTRDVSFIWPLTSMGFIVTTVAAHFILHERVTALRWAGVLLIALGACLTSYSESAKKNSPPANVPADSTSVRTQ